MRRANAGRLLIDLDSAARACWCDFNGNEVPDVLREFFHSCIRQVKIWKKFVGEKTMDTIKIRRQNSYANMHRYTAAYIRGVRRTSCLSQDFGDGFVCCNVFGQQAIKRATVYVDVWQTLKHSTHHTDKGTGQCNKSQCKKFRKTNNKASLAAVTFNTNGPERCRLASKCGENCDKSSPLISQLWMGSNSIMFLNDV